MSYTIVPSTDHVERGKAKLLEQFKNSPRMNAILSSYLRRIQELEDAIWEVIIYRTIPNGFGIVLDRIGKIVGRKRAGLDDDDYKIALRAQIRINRSSGTPEDIIDVARLSLPEGFTFQYLEGYPATVIININEQVTFSILTLFRNLIMTKDGGVRLLVNYSEDDPAEIFTLAHGLSVSDTSDTRGLGWSGDPSLGGRLRNSLQG